MTAPTLRPGRARRPLLRLGTLCALLLSAACGPPRTAPPRDEPGAQRPAARQRGELPPVAARSGALRIDLVYPGEGQALAVRDSNFIFGSVGTGGVSLRIDDVAVPVHPNGAFLAFLPVPADGSYRLVATAGGNTVRAERRVRVPAAPAPPAATARLTVVQGSVTPRGAFAVAEGEPVEVGLRGTPGATARLVLPDGTVVPLSERPVTERSEGFMLDRVREERGISEYVGSFPARAGLLAADRSVRRPALLGPESARASRPGAVVELIRGGDTIRTPLNLALEVFPAGVSRVAVAASARPDRAVTGTAIPGGGTPYHWSFPNGTQLAVTGARGDQYRVRLTDELTVWVDTAEVDLLPLGIPAPRGTVGTVRAIHAAEHLDLRFATSGRLPFRVDPTERGLTVTLYGAETRTNWLQYGQSDSLLRRMEWEQPADDVYRVHVELAEPLWGFLPFWNESDQLIVRIRRPPPIDPEQPLRGLYIAVDAGHPPGGAIGPTRYTEAEANLAIAKRLVPMLRARGARVLETRPDTAAVALGIRPIIATDSSVHLLVSVHNNAFPDGVNPFENNGTSVFYNQAHSLDLARALQAELLQELGLRDLGIARADLALVRPTWMPSALTETMFLMVPEQEAALRDPAVQQRIAEAHLRGIEAFLRGRVRSGR